MSMLCLAGLSLPSISVSEDSYRAAVLKEIAAKLSSRYATKPHGHSRFKRRHPQDVVAAFQVRGGLTHLAEHPTLSKHLTFGIEIHPQYDTFVFEAESERVTAARFLDMVMVRLGTYTWRYQAGTINIFPKDRTGKLSRVLDRKIEPFNSEGLDLHYTLDLLLDSLNRAGWEIFKPGFYFEDQRWYEEIKPHIPADERISVHISTPVSLRTALNILVNKDPPAYWRADLDGDQVMIMAQQGELVLQRVQGRKK